MARAAPPRRAGPTVPGWSPGPSPPARPLRWRRPAERRDPRRVRSCPESAASGGTAARPRSTPSSSIPVGAAPPTSPPPRRATASPTPTGASSTSHTPPGNWSLLNQPISIAVRVLPTPPEPVNVTNRRPDRPPTRRRSSARSPTYSVTGRGRLPSTTSIGGGVAFRSTPAARTTTTSTGSLTPRRRREPTGRISTPGTPVASPAVTADARICPPRATDMTAPPGSPPGRRSRSPARPPRPNADPSAPRSTHLPATPRPAARPGRPRRRGRRRQRGRTPPPARHPPSRTRSRREPRPPRSATRHGERSPRPSPPASCSHSPVEPTTSVNKNVTVPDGGRTLTAPERRQRPVSAVEMVGKVEFEPAISASRRRRRRPRWSLTSVVPVATLRGHLASDGMTRTPPRIIRHAHTAAETADFVDLARGAQRRLCTRSRERPVATWPTPAEPDRAEASVTDGAARRRGRFCW